MIISKTLLLKGLGGTGALLGAGGLVMFRKEIFGVNKAMDLSSFKDKELIEKVGLDCGLTADDIGSETKECSVKTGRTINVKKGEQVEEGVSYSNTPKLKVSRSESGGYTKKLKFVVDSGDITLTKSGGSASTINKLEQFETYEITAEEKKGKFYLTRKTEAKEEKKNILGLSKCDLPASGDSTCSFTTEEIKTVKFDGVTGENGITVSNGNVTLKISKMNDTTTFGEDNYRFTFTFPSDVTISSTNTVKANTPYDFKIKKDTSNPSTLSLEKAWSDDNAFTKKAGLDCTTNTECNVSSETQKLNVRVGDSKKENITNKSGSGKIKMEKEQPGYNQGLKFTITTGEVGLTGGTGSTDITKLEELETYEITEEGGKYYLTRKDEASKNIERLLGLPTGCGLSSTSHCSLTSEQLQKINFSDKENPSGTASLTISKVTNTTDFTLGYKFTLQSAQDITIKTNTNTVKANIPTDFKIKKDTSNPSTLTLEKAWTSSSLATKVGLQSCDETSNECTINGNIKVMQEDNKDTNLSKNTSGSNGAKIKVIKDQEGYNQGFKFTIEDGSITLDGSTAQEENKKIKSLDEYETYEIKEEGGEWYLVRKDKAQVFIKKQLGLEEICTTDFPTSTNTTQKTCDITSVEQLKNIKFEGKDSHASWPTETSINVQLAIDRDDALPSKLKFTFNKRNNSSLCLPGETGSTGSSNDVVYKIKKNGSSPNISLTLEKKE